MENMDKAITALKAAESALTRASIRLLDHNMEESRRAMDAAKATMDAVLAIKPDAYKPQP